MASVKAMVPPELSVQLKAQYDEISPCHALLLALGVTEYVAVVEGAVGDSATHDAQGIG